MPDDIYGKNQVWGNAQLLTADTATLTINRVDATLKEFLVQNIAVQYNRPVNNIYEIGSSNVYFAPTRATGTFQIGRIVGSQSILGLIPSTSPFWKDGGVPGDRIMTIKPGGTNASSASWTISGCIIESYGIATDANGLLVQENISGRFAGLVVT